MQFREDHIDFKELLKRREQQRQNQLKSKNPFAIPLQSTNEEVYKQLYKFDPQRELKEHQFNQQPEKLQIPEQQVDDEETQQDLQEQEQSYNAIVRGVFKEKKQVSKIQKANYVDAAVYNEYVRTFHTGEDAIRFFAKYGNTTPIKFINCISKVAEMELRYENYLKKQKDQTKARLQPPMEFDKAKEQFKPYDLIVISTSENQKELTLKEYYTISAHGIVHVYTDKAKRKIQGDTSTEVISLSDWMINKKILILKSEKLSQQQTQQLVDKGYLPVQVNLLKFQYHKFQLDQHYDYIFLNSPNGAISLLNNINNTQFNELFVVGEQSRNKLQEFYQNITVFKNQNELIDKALTLQKSKILYIIGSLSEIDERLKQNHDLTIRLGYETLPNDEIDQAEISDVSVIVYYSKSNYDFFQKYTHLLKNDVQNIFWGPKAASSSQDPNKLILQNPTFDDLLNLL